MFFIEHQIIIFVTKRIRLNFLLRPSDLKSDFTLTLGYLNLALNNPALEYSTLTFHSPVKSLYMYVANMYFTPTAPSSPSSVLEPLSDIWYRCRSGVCSPLCFSKLHNSFNTVSDNVHEQLRDSDW